MPSDQLTDTGDILTDSAGDFLTVDGFAVAGEERRSLVFDLTAIGRTSPVF